MTSESSAEPGAVDPGTVDYRRVVELVDAALDMDASSREEFLNWQCVGQPELRAEVDSLLEESLLEEAETQGAEFLGQPAMLEIVDFAKDWSSGDTQPIQAESQTPPSFVGPYKVIEELGRGGMGTVYLAEQREPIERRVALKVMRGFDGVRGNRRFAAECAALARLKHPNIAAVYDAGVTEDSRAFVAMEWVEGSHITDWCDQNQLSTRARIELFLGVCAGVSHAHQKGVVHRDLKPSNILVAEVDGKATAKVIDFGIARSLDEGEEVAGEGHLSFTESGEMRVSSASWERSRSMLMGSPVYMSPEAAQLYDRADVDTRTDVYSLGILLYELLVGTLPFDMAGLGVLGILSRVSTTDSPAPSLRFAELDAERQESVAILRGDRPKDLERSLRGDLDAILSKAMARRREDRYDGVGELASDLQRHLQSRPVEARESSPVYNLSRFIGRNLGAVTAVALLIGVLGIGVAARTQEARRANMEAERARKALAEVEQVSEFLIGLFEVVDPDRGLDDPESVDELLAKAETTMDEELADQPLARARFLQTLARIAMSRTDLERAADLYEQTLALREQYQPPGHEEIITTVGSLGVIYRRQGRYDESESLLLRAVEMLEQSDDPDPAQFAATLTWLGNLHYDQKRFEEAVAGHTRALEIRRQEDPLNPGALGESLNNLGVALRSMGRYTEAVPILREAGDYFVEAFGPDNALSVAGTFNMAGIEEKLGNWQEAERLLQHSGDSWLRIYGPTHHRTLLAQRALGSLWIRWRRADDAVSYLRKLLVRQLTGAPDDRLEIARTRVALGQALTLQEDFDAAERELDIGIDLYVELLGENQYTTNSARARQAVVTWKKGDGEGAAETLAELLVKRREAKGDDHSGVAFFNVLLGYVLLDEGRLDEAEVALEEALRIHESIHQGPSVYVGHDLLWLARLRVEQGRTEDARKLFARSASILKKVLPPGHPDLVAAEKAS